MQLCLLVSSLRKDGEFEGRKADRQMWEAGWGGGMRTGFTHTLD